MYDKGGKQTRSGMCSVFAAKATATTAAATATATATASKCHQQHCRESTVFCSIPYLRVLLHCWAECGNICGQSKVSNCLQCLDIAALHPQQRMHTSSRVGPCLLFVLFCADSASSCSTIGNLHEALLPQLPQSQGLPARSSRSPCNYMERDLLGEINTERIRLHLTSLPPRCKLLVLLLLFFTHDFLFIAKLSLFLGRPWRQRALLIRTDEPRQSKWHR